MLSMKLVTTGLDNILKDAIPSTQRTGAAQHWIF